MTKRMFAILGLAVLLSAGLLGCTANERARSFGGTEALTLPCGQKLINATWKESNFWYLSRNMREGETAESYTFKEVSNWGTLEGTILINECSK